MKIKLLFVLFTFCFITSYAQNYIFGKITTEEKFELQDVTVINIRTDERVLSNKDGHFMISGRQGDLLRFIKNGFDRIDRRMSKEDVESPVNITLLRTAAPIAEVEIKKELTGDLKIDTKNLNPPKKVEKLKADIGKYLRQKSDPRILAARPGEFVQPKGQGFFIGKVKNKWDDIDFKIYLEKALGDQYFKDLNIEKTQIQHFINFVLAGGFERKTILKYGYCSDADLFRFQRAVLTRIEAYKAPLTTK